MINTVRADMFLFCLVCVDSPDLSAAMAVWLSKEPRPWLNGRCKSAFPKERFMSLSD